jgi:hypothetical protein
MCGKIWLDHDALEYRKCKGDAPKISMGIPFPKMIKIKPIETIFSHGLPANREIIEIELIQKL